MIVEVTKFFGVTLREIWEKVHILRSSPRPERGAGRDVPPYAYHVLCRRSADTTCRGWYVVPT
jgi:hypothetical protein